MNDKIYTVTQAVREVMSDWTVGTIKHGTDIHREVLVKLGKHNSPYKPMDGTVLRILRHFRELYGVELYKRDISAYIKRAPEQPNLTNNIA